MCGIRMERRCLGLKAMLPLRNAAIYLTFFAIRSSKPLNYRLSSLSSRSTIPSWRKWEEKECSPKPATYTNQGKSRNPFTLPKQPPMATYPSETLLRFIWNRAAGCPWNRAMSSTSSTSNVDLLSGVEQCGRGVVDEVWGDAAAVGVDLAIAEMRRADPCLGIHHARDYMRSVRWIQSGACETEKEASCILRSLL